jgi:hypothetical protein
MIANIVDGWPNKESLDEGIKTTLIVAPNYLLAMQFKEEIKVHVKEKCRPRTLVYDSKQPNSGNFLLKELKKLDIM